MGCGASICRACAPPPKQSADQSREALLLPQQRGLVTPPGSRRASRNAHNPPTQQLHQQPGLKAGLRIDPRLAEASREKEGIAETPIGKAADEYKYYCPICMMFFRSICELPCCKQSTCAFCFAEYAQKQQPKHSSAIAAAAAYAAPAAAPAAAGVKGGVALVLQAGMACPQCAVVPKRPLDLRVVEGFDEQRVAYLDSPQTRAQMERISKSHNQHLGKASPLKVGDDFNTMARKMLPFKEMEPHDEAPAEEQQQQLPAADAGDGKGSGGAVGAGGGNGDGNGGGGDGDGGGSSGVVQAQEAGEQAAAAAVAAPLQVADEASAAEPTATPAVSAGSAGSDAATATAGNDSGGDGGAGAVEAPAATSAAPEDGA